MNINKLEQEIEDLQATLEEKKKQLSEAKEREPFVPKYGETYYFVADTGEVLSTWKSKDCRTDERKIAIHNCFRTYEEAEAVDKKVKEILANYFSWGFTYR